jgi:hypothetical protein
VAWYWIVKLVKKLKSMLSERDSPIYFQTKSPFYKPIGIHINSLVPV